MAGIESFHIEIAILLTDGLVCFYTWVIKSYQYLS